jgi:hypothetical protein
LGNAVEKLRSRQIDLKERAAAAKTAAWTKAVEKVRSKQAALVKQAAVETRLNLAEPCEILQPLQHSQHLQPPTSPLRSSERVGARAGRKGSSEAG